MDTAKLVIQDVKHAQVMMTVLNVSIRIKLFGIISNVFHHAQKDGLKSESIVSNAQILTV
jgi:hypothetical protein